MAKQKKLRKDPTNVPGSIVILIGSFIMIFPFVWMILSAFKTPGDVYAYPPKWLPSQWNLDNFKAVFDLIPFWTYYGNSIFTSVVQTFLQISISILAAYALTKLRFPGRNFMYKFLQSSMFVPTVVTIIPTFLIISKMGLVNTYAGIILPQIMSAFTTMLIMSFFVSVPNELLEAARIDGCGYMGCLFKIMLPSSVSGITTAALFSFLGHWKSYQWPLIVTNSTKLRTLPIGLKYLVQESSSEYQVMMAAAVLTVVPVLIVYSIYEKQLVKSITLTGIK
ncbi:MAG: carbohydrate ABC transporter permease [Ruminococcaceae bacterium]|nr:carbohydrate ABC transporter permease [Oscillospiraceae bacterium]